MSYLISLDKHFIKYYKKIKDTKYRDLIDNIIYNNISIDPYFLGH
jgi:hypothetical protein